MGQERPIMKTVMGRLEFEMDVPSVCIDGSLAPFPEFNFFFFLENIGTICIALGVGIRYQDRV